MMDFQSCRLERLILKKKICHSDSAGEPLQRLGAARRMVFAEPVKLWGRTRRPAGSRHSWGVIEVQRNERCQVVNKQSHIKISSDVTLTQHYRLPCSSIIGDTLLFRTFHSRARMFQPTQTSDEQIPWSCWDYDEIIRLSYNKRS